MPAQAPSQDRHQTPYLPLEGPIQCSHDHSLAGVGHGLAELHNVGKLERVGGEESHLHSEQQLPGATRRRPCCIYLMVPPPRSALSREQGGPDWETSVCALVPTACVTSRRQLSTRNRCALAPRPVPRAVQPGWGCSNTAALTSGGKGLPGAWLDPLAG